MKKHFVLIFICTLTTIINVQAQSFTATSTHVPEVTFQKIRKATEEQFGAFTNQVYKNNPGYCNCDKCQKQHKSKKHNDCKQRGNHYGKHKNHQGKHSCSCDGHNCKKDDRRYEQNGRNNGNRYGSRKDDSRQKAQTGQHSPAVKVKSGPASKTTRPTPASRPTAQKKVVTRPAGTR